MILSGAPVLLSGSEGARTYPMPRKIALVASVTSRRPGRAMPVTEARLDALAASSDTPERVRAWAVQTGRALALRRVRARERVLLACGCGGPDTAQYRALLSPDHPDDLVVVAVTRQDEDSLYSWRPERSVWESVPANLEPVGMPYLDLDPDMLAGLLESLQEEDAYLALRPDAPLARIDQRIVAAAAPGKVFAVVDALDPGAVLDLLTIDQGQIRRRLDSDWVDAPELISALKGVDPPKVVPLDPGIVERVLKEIDEFDSLQKAKQAKPGEPVEKGKPEAEVAAAVATTRMDPGLVAYWTKGKGALKVKWGVPGDFKRCGRHLRKYLRPDQVDGACANLHKIALGVWPGQER